MEFIPKNGQLGLAEIDTKELIKAIKSGKLQGRYDKKERKGGKEVMLISKSKKLYKFFK